MSSMTISLEEPDKAFGITVARWRKTMDLTQKQFAERLTGLGMKVDAAAVSRIESGTRSVRISEAALIAKALETDFASLARVFGTSPEREVSSAFREAEMSRALLVDPITEFARTHTMLETMIVEYPSLTAAVLRHPSGPGGSSIPDYLNRIAERIRNRTRQAREAPTHDMADSLAPYSDADVRDAIHAVLAALLDDKLATWEELSRTWETIAQDTSSHGTR